MSEDPGISEATAKISNKQNFFQKIQGEVAKANLALKAKSNEIKSINDAQEAMPVRPGLALIQEATRNALHLLPGFTYPDVQRYALTKVGNYAGLLAQGVALGVGIYQHIHGQPVDMSTIQTFVLGRFTQEVSGLTAVNTTLAAEAPQHTQDKNNYREQIREYKKKKTEYKIAVRKGEQAEKPTRPDGPARLRIEMRHESREVKALTKLTSLVVEASLPDTIFGRDVTDPDLKMRHQLSNSLQLGFIGLIGAGAASGNEMTALAGFLGYAVTKLSSAGYERAAARRFAKGETGTQGFVKKPDLASLGPNAKARDYVKAGEAAVDVQKIHAEISAKLKKSATIEDIQDPDKITFLQKVARAEEGKKQKATQDAESNKAFKAMKEGSVLEAPLDLISGEEDTILGKTAGAAELITDIRGLYSARNNNTLGNSTELGPTRPDATDRAIGKMSTSVEQQSQKAKSLINRIKNWLSRSKPEESQQIIDQSTTDGGVLNNE
jgi:hypothetical protein